MNGPIAQIVALTCHGNAFLTGRTIQPFFPSNSTCTFCDRVNFVVVEKSLFKKLKEKEVAKTPDDWFSYLRSSGATGIRLFRSPGKDPHISDRMSAGFVGGGGTWAMEVLLPKNRSEYWLARWEVWNQQAQENRIWRVTYGRVSDTATPKENQQDMNSLSKQLEKSLREIHSFSARHDCSGFTKWFADALDTLETKGEHLHGYHKDLAPEHFLPDEATMVLHACQKSWVFGGMGSWNDMGFDGKEQEEYERVSEQLFEDLNKAIAAGANASFYKNAPLAAAGETIGVTHWCETNTV